VCAPASQIANRLVVDPVGPLRLAAIDRIRCFRSRAEPHVVVKIIRYRCWFIRSACAPIGCLDFDRSDVANCAAENDFTTNLLVLCFTLLSTVLEDPILAEERFVTHQVLFDRQPQRLFDVDVLTRSGCHQSNEDVPMIGRRDDYSIDIFAIEDLAKIGVRLTLDRSCCRLTTILVTVGDRDAFNSRIALRLAHQE